MTDLIDKVAGCMGDIKSNGEQHTGYSLLDQCLRVNESPQMAVACYIWGCLVMNRTELAKENPDELKQILLAVRRKVLTNHPLAKEVLEEC